MNSSTRVSLNEDRYFDVLVEYAKESPEDILVRITAANRGPRSGRSACVADPVVPHDWSNWIAESNRTSTKPVLTQVDATAGATAVAVTHPLLDDLIFSCEGHVPLLFTENETNHERLFLGQKNESPYVKDGINDYIVQGNMAR